MPGPGTKVNEPHNEIQSGTGAIANDSLAAESTRAGGAFSENENSTPQGVSGSNSTFANTNTSGAKKISPARDTESRGMPSESYSQAKEYAVTNTEGSYDTGGSTSNAGVAPNYVKSGDVSGELPKGRNLTEGGFEGYDGKNASYSQDIGGKNDPGRVALGKLERTNADTVGTAGLPRQKGDSGENMYNNLGSQTSA